MTPPAPPTPRSSARLRAGLAAFVSRRSPADVVHAAVFVLPLVVLPSALQGFDLPKAIGAGVVAVGTAVLAVLVRSRTDAPDRSVRLLATLAMVAASWLLLRSVTLADPVGALLGLSLRYQGSLAFLASAVLVVVVPRLVRRQVDITTLAIVLTAMLGLVAVQAILQQTSMPLTPWRPVRYGKSVGMFGNSNMLGAVIAFGPPTAAYLWYAVPRLRAALPTFVVATFGTLFFAASSLGALATVVGVALFVMLQRTSGRLRWALLAISPLLGHLAALAVVFGGHLVGLGSATARVVLLRIAAGVFAQAPLVGVGWGRFAVYGEQVRPAEAVTLGGPREVWADSSHMWLIDIAAMTGVIGLVLVFGLLAGTGYVLMRTGRRIDERSPGSSSSAPADDDGPAQQRLAQQRLAQQRLALHWLAALLATSGVGLGLTVPVVVLVWFAMLFIGLVGALAVVVAAPTGPTAPTGPAAPTAAGSRPWLSATLTIVAMAVTLLGAQPLLRGAQAIQRAEDAAQEEAWSQAVVAGQRATEVAPWWPKAWTVLANAQLELGAFDAAAESIERTLAIDQRDRAAIRQAGVVAGRRGADDEAAAAFARAIEFDPLGFDVRLDQAEWAIGAGRLEVAREALDHAAPFMAPTLDEYERFERLRRALELTD